MDLSLLLPRPKSIRTPGGSSDLRARRVLEIRGKLPSGEADLLRERASCSAPPSR
jgi:hypothetical protein